MNFLFEAGPPSEAWINETLAADEDYMALASVNAGRRVMGGLYRVHNRTSGKSASDAIAHGFPEFAENLNLFGFDWLGRQFGLDGARSIDGRPAILLFEPVSGDVLDVPYTLATFHDDWANVAEPAFALSAFTAFQTEFNDGTPIELTHCAGYRQPLFLGGSDTGDNLELVATSVYLPITCQLLIAARQLPLGSKIGAVTISDPD